MDSNDIISNRDAKVAGVAMSVGIFLARAFYRHRYIPIKLVNKRLNDMFTRGDIKSADGGNVLLQFFK